MALAVSRSSATAGVPRSRLGHFMWVSKRMKQSGAGFLGVFPVFSCHEFNSTIWPYSSHSFHFISPCDDTTAIVDRHPYYSQQMGFIASHPSTRPCVGHEFEIFVLSTIRVMRGFPWKCQGNPPKEKILFLFD